MVDTLPPDRTIGSVWRRSVAFVIDGILVGIAASAIALPFFNAFSRLGAWGPLLGFCMALPYFAILDSTIGNGQTLGKRWLRLRVVDAHGNTISFSKSLARYALFAVPYFLNGISLPISRTPWVVSDLLSVVIFGLGGATFYLMLFNRQTRQGIHDLVVGSYVTDGDGHGPVKTQAIWRIHWAILVSLLTVLLGALVILGNTLAKWEPFPQLLEDARLIESLPGVQQAGVQDLTNWSGDKKTKIFVTNVFWTGGSAEEAFADRVAKLVLQSDPRVKDYGFLRVVMIRGYDLGIAHANRTQAFEHTPADWNARLLGNSSEESSTPAKQ